MEDTLFLITARSGSKGVPHKNIKKLFGIPLLGIRGLSALQLSSPENVWLSTDSHEYAEIGRKYGIHIPFLRPEDLASDKATSSDVVLHAMQYASNMGRTYRYIALLEPTSPFVYTEHLCEAIQNLKDNKNADAIVATKKMETSSIFVQPDDQYLTVLAENLSQQKNIRRQDFRSEITPSGGFYISKWDNFLKNKTFYTAKTLSYKLPEECSLEIDSELQFAWATFLIERDLINKNKIISNENI